MTQVLDLPLKVLLIVHACHGNQGVQIFQNARHAACVAWFATYGLRSHHDHVRWGPSIGSVATGVLVVSFTVQDGSWTESNSNIECNSSIDCVEFPQAVGAK